MSPGTWWPPSAWGPGRRERWGAEDRQGTPGKAVAAPSSPKPRGAHSRPSGPAGRSDFHGFPSLLFPFMFSIVDDFLLKKKAEKKDLFHFSSHHRTSPWMPGAPLDYCALCWPQAVGQGLAGTLAVSPDWKAPGWDSPGPGVYWKRERYLQPWGGPRAELRILFYLWNCIITANFYLHATVLMVHVHSSAYIFVMPLL